LEALVAEQHGYRRAGLRQRRALARFGSRHWLVVDDILGQGRHHAQLRWNLPDLPWKLSKSSLYLDAPAGPVELEIEAPGASLALFRAGEAIAGEAKRPRPTFGWQAPGYDHLKPALTLIAALEAQLPLRLISHWRLGAHSAQARTIGWKPPGVGAFPWTHLAWGDETLDT
jgi:hypothetical protein